MKNEINKGTFPWGTKGELNRIGNKLRNKSEISPDEAGVLEIWRASHFNVMNAFQAMLRTRTKGQPITVAQRHKRRTTIIDKLSREPGMELARMDDVAGVRLIFANIEGMKVFRENFLRSSHRHKQKNQKEKYDYTINPKTTGYRGIHDIYSYNSNGDKSKIFNGTMIEIQYRTIHTHAWATANEVVTMAIGQKTKFGVADADYISYFQLTSELFSRAFDRMTGICAHLTNRELLNQIKIVDDSIHINQKLKNLNFARTVLQSSVIPKYQMQGGMLLSFSPTGTLTVHPVPPFINAMQYYFKFEKENTDADVVLVNSSDPSHIRSAYRNYYSDTTEFIEFTNLAKAIIEDDGQKKLY